MTHNNDGSYVESKEITSRTFISRSAKNANVDMNEEK